jgi:hypothetical protein
VEWRLYVKELSVLELLNEVTMCCTCTSVTRNKKYIKNLGRKPTSKWDTYWYKIDKRVILKLMWKYEL